MLPPKIFSAFQPRPVLPQASPGRSYALAFATLLFGALLPGLSGCGPPAPPSTSTENPAPEQDALVLLLGDDMKDLEFLQSGMEAAVGRKLQFQYSRGMEAVDRVRAHDAAKTVDFAWPASDLYLRSLSGGQIVEGHSIARTPLVLGLKKGSVESLGWDKRPPSWDDLAKSLKARGLKLGMGNPAGSDLGLLELLSAGVVFGDNREPLNKEDLASPRLRELYSSAKLLGGGARWLSEVYAREEDRLDGILTFESSLLSLNLGDTLDEKLPVTPIRDGTLSANFPLLLVNSQHKAEYDKLLAYLKSTPVQTQIMERTFRRPVDPKITLGAKLDTEHPPPLAAAVRPDALENMVATFSNQIRPPAHTYFLLDISGSMAEENRMDDLKTSLGVLAGSDDDNLAGRAARFAQREKVDILSFDSRLQTEVSLDFSAPKNYAASLRQFQQFVDGLQPKGGTAIYDALQAAYERALKDRKKQPEYLPTIILVTDGHNASGQPFGTFRDWLQAQPDTAQDIRVFPVLFGEVEDREMKELAALTHGKVFDSTGATLTREIERVRVYQ